MALVNGRVKARDLLVHANGRIEGFGTLELAPTGLYLNNGFVDPGLSPGTLTIDGDALDSIEAGTGWTDGGVSGGYHTYTQGTATINVDTDVTVNANILV